MKPADIKINNTIKTFLRNNNKVSVKDIIEKTGYSQPYISKFITKLMEEGKLIKIGGGRATVYIKPHSANIGLINKYSARLTNKNLSESDVLENIRNRSGIFKNIQSNIRHILEYAFTEMLNNAIEHSRSKQIEFNIERQNDLIRFDIIDKGIGLFNNLIKKYKLKDVYEAVQELLKGKRTTMPEAHSGEGIFFTSKSADTFIIQSSGKKLLMNNLINDIFLSSSKVKRGTKITFTIGLDSRRKLKNIFDEYTDEEFVFNKTKILVKMYKYGNELLSRSQARRILTGLEKFKQITLDFQRVEQIGQAFADEIFRIYKRKYTHKVINYINANKDVEFMIKRALKNNL